MKKHEAWRPKLRQDPVFNPFEPSTEWTAQLGDGDRIEFEDEAEEDSNVPANPETGKTDDK